MCGIYFSLSRRDFERPDAVSIQRLKERGPDSFEELCVYSKSPKNSADQTQLVFASSVLSLRGDRITKQPSVSKVTSFICCWNGEAWQVGGAAVEGNDTELVSTLLSEAAVCNCSRSQNAHGVLEECEVDCTSSCLLRVLQAISNIAGPYALVFYDHIHGRIFFARDPLGRRSLLYRQDIDGCFVITSVSDGDVAKSWQEVQADGVYVINLSSGHEEDNSTSISSGIIPLAEPSFELVRFPWTFARMDGDEASLHGSLVGFSSQKLG